MKSFMHPVNFRQNIRVKRLMQDLPGGIGYGVAMLTIETLAGQPGMRYPAEAVDLLALDIGVSLPILNTVLTAYGLFDEIRDENGKSYICQSLNEWQEPYDKKVEINRLRGRKSAIQNQLRLQVQIEELKQILSASDSTQQITETIKKEKKESLSPVIARLIDKHNNSGAEWGNIAGYASISIINGYLHDNTTNKDLAPDEAAKVWELLTIEYGKK